MASEKVPRIESLRIRNYRALRDVRLDDLSSLTVLLGPNSSGKSTLFDLFGFLSEALRGGLRPAWDKRGRMKELRSREASGPISFELRYRESRESPVITYFLEIDEEGGRPIVRHETLRWRRGSHGKPFNFLNFDRGRGQVVAGDLPEEDDERRDATLASPTCWPSPPSGSSPRTRAWSRCGSSSRVGISPTCPPPTPAASPTLGPWSV
jgi:predicted ATPase